MEGCIDADKAPKKSDSSVEANDDVSTYVQVSLHDCTEATDGQVSEISNTSLQPPLKHKPLPSAVIIVARPLPDAPCCKSSYFNR